MWFYQEQGLSKTIAGPEGAGRPLNRGTPDGHQLGNIPRLDKRRLERAGMA